MADVSESPLHFVLLEIERTFNGGLYYASIALALTLPDICSAAEFDLADENFWRGAQKRYEGWCSRYVEKHLPELTASDIWALRGGVIHRGQTFGHPKSRFKRVVFTLPDPNGNIVTGNTSVRGDDLPVRDVSAHRFCQIMINAANMWLVEKNDDELVKRNIDGLLRMRPYGYEGHIRGLAVIA